MFVIFLSIFLNFEKLLFKFLINFWLFYPPKCYQINFFLKISISSTGSVPEIEIHRSFPKIFQKNQLKPTFSVNHLSQVNGKGKIQIANGLPLVSAMCITKVFVRHRRSTYFEDL